MKYAAGLLFICATVCFALSASAVGAAAADHGGFRRASLMPADVSLYLHVENAAALRDQLAARPLAAWIENAWLQGEAARTWGFLARDAGVEPGALLDRCFGRAVTLATRSAGDVTDWVLLTEMPRDAALQLIRQLRATTLGPRFGGAAYELPEHDLLLIQLNHLLLIGPRNNAKATQTPLLQEVASRVSMPVNRPAETATLASLPAFAEASLPAGSVSLYLRHNPPMGGWSLATLQMQQDRLALRQHSRFESAPFSRDLSELEINLNTLAAFKDRSLIAILEPTDTGRSQFEAFTAATIGEGIISPAMRRNMAERRLLIVGEVEGREEPEPFDLLSPTIAICIELRDPAIAEQQLDRQMLALARRINQTGQGRYQLRLPAVEAFEPDSPRVIDLSPASQWLTGGLPLAKPVSLSWRVARGQPGHGDWYVIASHPKQLDDTVRAIKAIPAQDCELAEKRPGLHHSGVMNGGRISHHLHSWSDQAALLGALQQTDELQEILRLLSELAAGIQQASWNVTRPSRNEMRLELDALLAPPESANP